MSTRSPLLNPSSRSLRDSFLKQFSSVHKIGRVYSAAGDEIHPGKTAVEWSVYFRLIDSRNYNRILTIQELQNLFFRLSTLYHQASSFHSNIFTAAENLKGIIERKESEFIEAEIAKYSPGGEYFDSQANKTIQRRPGKEVLERLAKNSVKDLRRAYRDLKMEADFFAAIMTDLEFQRRCLKDYAELLALDPSLKNL